MSHSRRAEPLVAVGVPVALDQLITIGCGLRWCDIRKGLSVGKGLETADVGKMRVLGFVAVFTGEDMPLIDQALVVGIPGNRRLRRTVNATWPPVRAFA